MYLSRILSQYNKSKYKTGYSIQAKIYLCQKIMWFAYNSIVKNTFIVSKEVIYDDIRKKIKSYQMFMMTVNRRPVHQEARIL